MKTLGAIAAFVVLIVWDFAQNNGNMTHSVIAYVVSLIRSFGF